MRILSNLWSQKNPTSHLMHIRFLLETNERSYGVLGWIMDLEHSALFWVSTL